MILHTNEVTPLSDYRLSLRFNNGRRLILCLCRFWNKL